MNLDNISRIKELANEIRDKELKDFNVELRPFSDGDIRCVIKALEQFRIEKKVRAGEQDIADGNVRSQEDVFSDLSLTGTRCSVCNEPQYKTPGGDVCKNGHGGAPPLEDT
jgi:hypothetical protein